MTREQKLRMRIQEIEDSLMEFSNELARISEENLRKSDSDYNRWVHNRFFDTKDTLVERIESETTSYMNTLHEAVSYLCSSDKEKTKVTLYILGESQNTTTYISNQGFEKIKEDFIKCPSCGSWVHKHCFSCDCGHSMGTREDKIELFLSNGVVERAIKDGLCSKRYELVINGNVYPAEYQLVPKGTDVKELVETKSKQDDAANE